MSSRKHGNKLADPTSNFTAPPGDGETPTRGMTSFAAHNVNCKFGLLLARLVPIRGESERLHRAPENRPWVIFDARLHGHAQYSRSNAGLRMESTQNQRFGRLPDSGSWALSLSPITLCFLCKFFLPSYLLMKPPSPPIPCISLGSCI